MIFQSSGASVDSVPGALEWNAAGAYDGRDMTVENPFHEWLAEVAADEVTVRPADIAAECGGNTWSFSLSPEQAAVVTPADVAAFAASIAESRGAWLIMHRHATMVLYWWHDAMAGQLRFSLVSTTHGRLPFRCDVVRAPFIEAVASDWLGSDMLHGVRPDGKHGTVHEDLAERSLSVWSVVVGARPDSAA